VHEFNHSSQFAAVLNISEIDKFNLQLAWGEDRSQPLFIFKQKEWVQSCWISLKPIAVDGTVKTNASGFRDNFSFDTERYVSHDMVCDNPSGKKEW
jgi:hypothetical protein